MEKRCLNTSYVSVKQTFCLHHFANQLGLNTSYVSVKLGKLQGVFLKLDPCLNTSYVSVKHKLNLSTNNTSEVSIHHMYRLNNLLIK